MSPLSEQIWQAKSQADHLGSCTRIGLTPEQQTELDNKYFAALEQLQYLRRQLASQRAQQCGVIWSTCPDGRIRKNHR